ncbi:Chitin synthase, class 1 [Serendipita sp. 399]|nr:Chitin synthase, class 1 [Serendipita sp. 399]
MYRLKARKANDDDWVPLITKPEIVREYSQSEVTTLHQKNLLLLGEDRFLTTILLRTFPNRKMMFCPQARCRTIVPDSFMVLLSQRRRWINSTIHNLMELVRVQNLCGTFCFSMQFVVFMDLLGTVVLPVAIALTYWLIAALALNPPKHFEQYIPLIMLCSVLGLPAVLILITTRKIVYVFWMFIYLAALPIWNFVLPIYAFWHFDDFSWGETRRVEGEGKQKGHDIGSATLAEGTQVPLRRWEDWERSRIRKLKREAQRKREMERNFPGGMRSAPRGPEQYSMAFSEFNDDSTSLAPSEDDRWGAQVGAYNESSAQWAPPPVALLPEDDLLHNAETVGGDELEAILERGFDDRPNRDSSTTMGSSGPLFANQSRYQLSDQGVMMPPPASGRFDSYTPLATRTPSPGPAITSFGDVHSPLSPTGGASSAVEFQTHVKKRSNGGRLRNDSEELLRHTPGTSPSSPQTDWGPMGPLDPQFTPQNTNTSRPYASIGRRI